MVAASALLASCATAPYNNTERSPQTLSGSYERNDGTYPPTTNNAASGCADCGVVLSIDIVPSDRTSSSGESTVLGGIVGAVAQNQNAPESTERSARSARGSMPPNTPAGSDSYDIKIKMDDGRTVVIHQADLQEIRENAAVRVRDGHVELR